MTIRDIARACGVSISTVSRVLNEHPDVTRPAAEYVDRDAKTGYGHLHGYPCHKYKRLSDSVFKDGHFVQIERRTDLKIAATSEENRMLEELLTSGVYI